MAQLKWTNVAAPQLAGTSQIIANAGKSFQTGLSAADAVLSKYNEGQQEKADNELLAQVASLNSEQQLGDFLNSDALVNKNISGGMRETILGLRKGILANDQTRSTTEGIDIRNVNSQQTGQRAQSEYIDMTNARTELRGLTGHAVGARNEGIANGYGNNQVLASQRGSYLTNELVKRGMSPVLAQAMILNLHDESGLNPNRNEDNPIVPGSRGGFGLGQWTGPRRKALEAYAAKNGQNPGNESTQLDFLMHEARTTESGSIGRASQAGTVGEAANILVRDFFRPAREHQESRGRRYLGVQGVKHSPKYNALSEAVGASLYQTPDQALELLTGAYNAQKEGQKRIDEDTALANREIKAGAFLEAINDPNVLSRADVQKYAENNTGVGGLSNTERLSFMNNINNNTGEGSVGRSILAPSVPTDTTIEASNKGYNQRVEAFENANPTTRLVNRSESEEYLNNPTEALINELDLMNDGETRTDEWWSNFDKKDLTNFINDLAKQSRQSPSAVAAAMFENFVRDPNGRNTIENRFDKNSILQYLDANLDIDSVSAHKERKNLNTKRRKDLEAKTLLYDTERVKAKKEKAKNGKVSEATQSKLDKLETEILNFNQTNPAEELYKGNKYEDKKRVRVQLENYLQSKGDLRKIANTKVGTEARKVAIKKAIENIKSDKNLSSQEKEVLISGFGG